MSHAITQLRDNEIMHNHEEPNVNEKFKCPACKAISLNLQPSEDGFYKFEQENDSFVSSYYMFWDAFEKAGILKQYDSPYGIMIENKMILKLTRAKEKLLNPNFISN